jgi:hypothetical protein
VSGNEIKGNIRNAWGFAESDIYLLYNGKPVSDSTTIENGIVHAVPRLVGGKGGFGSLLRSSGKGMNKSTNKESCRDLSGRRLRKINEENMLKKWIKQQAEREREASERRRRKLERLREEPKHKFHDLTYEKERSQLTEKISDAVEQGLRVARNNAGGTTCNKKRKATQTATGTAKKTCLWWDSGEWPSLSDDSDISDDDIQPGTSGNGRMVNNRATHDAVDSKDDDSKDPIL